MALLDMGPQGSILSGSVPTRAPNLRDGIWAIEKKLIWSCARVLWVNSVYYCRSIDEYIIVLMFYVLVF